MPHAKYLSRTKYLTHVKYFSYLFDKILSDKLQSQIFFISLIRIPDFPISTMCTRPHSRMLLWNILPNVSWVIGPCAYLLFIKIINCFIFLDWVFSSWHPYSGLISLIIRQKGEAQSGCYKKTKRAKFSKKRTFLNPW